jgi:hypothetical protein
MLYFNKKTSKQYHYFLKPIRFQNAPHPKKTKVQLGSPFFPMLFHALYPPFFLPFEFHLSLVSTSKKS